MSISIDEDTQNLADIDVGGSPDDSTEWWYNGGITGNYANYGSYDRLVTHAADLVEDGVSQLHELQLPGWEDYADEDDETTAEMIGGNVPPRKLVADVKLVLKQRKVEAETPDEPKPNQGNRVPWSRLWEDFDIPRASQSHTQLSLLVEASPKTSISENGSKAVDDAIAAGQLVNIRQGQYVPEAWT